jgi:hypothetical protein
MLATACIAAQSTFDVTPTQEFYELLFSDVVVRGTVISAETVTLPAPEVFPEYVGRMPSNSYADVLEVTLNVAEVMKGNESRNQIVVATKSPRDFPALGPGQEVIVGVYEDPDWLGGEVLRFKSEEGLFVRDGETWVSFGAVHNGRAYTLDAIEEQLTSVSMDQLSRSADVIFIGTVEQLSSRKYESPKREFAELATIDFHVERTLKGSLGAEVQVSMVKRGMYWPAWRWKMPDEMKSGDRYFVFLAKGDERIYVVGGVNGCYRVVDDRLIYDNRRTIPLRLSEAKRLVQRAVEQGR